MQTIWSHSTPETCTPVGGKVCSGGHVSSMGISMLCYPKYNEELMKNISRGKFLLVRVCSEQSYQCRFLDRRVYGSDRNIFLMDHSALKMWSTTIHVSTIYSDITIRKSTLQICHEKSSHTICPSQAILTAFIQISMTFKILLFNFALQIKHFKAEYVLLVNINIHAYIGVNAIYTELNNFKGMI